MLSNEQQRRYSRNIILKEVGAAGQEKLLNSKILVIGAGGLGSPAILYLAASGVGTIGVADYDKLELSNLQRQIIHETSDLNRPKTDSSADAVHDLNPEIKVISHAFKLDEKNAAEVIKDYDLVIDGSDNITTRFLVNDVCHSLKKTLVSAAILQFEGQISVYKSYEKNNPCYRCLFPETPGPDSMPSCSENGILGPVAGVMGSLIAVEAIKELLEIEQSLAGSLLIYDATNSNFRKVKLSKEPNCPTCSK